MSYSYDILIYFTSSIIVSVICESGIILYNAIYKICNFKTWGGMEGKKPAVFSPISLKRGSALGTHTGDSSRVDI